MRSATVIIFRPWRAQYSTRSSTRAIVPSSFMTSQITPAGFRPARRARSTAASVWPARSSTPPGLLFSGKMWPGWTRSRGELSESIATWIVRARSGAEMPVVTPSRASIDTVNGVSNGDSFLAAMRSRPSSSQRSGVSDRQIRPRPSLAMKFTASGVANCAAIVRSPSFSRSSSSQTTTILPSRMSSSASSIVANGLRVFELMAPSLPNATTGRARGRAGPPAGRQRPSTSSTPFSISSPASLAASPASSSRRRGPCRAPPGLLRVAFDGVVGAAGGQRAGERGHDGQDVSGVSV